MMVVPGILRTMTLTLVITNLFPGKIARYAQAEDRVQVRAENASGAWHCSTDDGRQWIRKGPGGSPMGTFAECACWLLAKELGLPVPNGAVLEGRHGRIWMSERVHPATHWRPGVTIDNPRDAVRVLLLDVLVNNGDRHYKNVLLEPAGGGRYRFIPIDFDVAEIGAHRESRPLVPRHPALPSFGPFWLRELPESSLNEFIDEASQDLDESLSANGGQRLETLAYMALEAAYSTPSASVDVASVVGYLRWRAPTAQTMARDYWKEARK